MDKNKIASIREALYVVKANLICEYTEDDAELFSTKLDLIGELGGALELARLIKKRNENKTGDQKNEC